MMTIARSLYLPKQELEDLYNDIWDQQFESGHGWVVSMNEISEIFREYGLNLEEIWAKKE